MVEGLINFSDWQKTDFRVGKVISVEAHPNADKLYVLKVDLGELRERTLVAGLKDFYSKEDLEGKIVIVFVNLEPAVLRGVKSEGMLLAADDAENGKIALLQPDKEIKLGSKIR